MYKDHERAAKTTTFLEIKVARQKTDLRLLGRRPRSSRRRSTERPTFPG